MQPVLCGCSSLELNKYIRLQSFRKIGFLAYLSFHSLTQRSYTCEKRPMFVLFGSRTWKLPLARTVFSMNSSVLLDICVATRQEINKYRVVLKQGASASLSAQKQNHATQVQCAYLQLSHYNPKNHYKNQYPSNIENIRLLWVGILTGLTLQQDSIKHVMWVTEFLNIKLNNEKVIFYPNPSQSLLFP